MSEQSQQAGPANQFVLESQADGSKTPIDGDCRVGRDPACQLVLGCDKGSRHHAELLLKAGALWVHDKNSTNGTFVNKRKISETTRLEDGDILQFGDTRFRVIAPQPEVAAADDLKTRVADPDSVRRMLEGRELPVQSDPEPSPAESSAKNGDAEKAEKEAPAEQPQAAARPSQARAPIEATDSSLQRKEEPGSSLSEQPARVDKNPSIPRSWADAEQLEQASHTEVFVRNSKFSSDTGSGAMHPLEAIAEARLKTAPELAILVGLREPVRGKLFELDHKGDTVKWEMGRGQDADIDVEDDSVSGRHAQLIYEKGRWKIVNMMSVNGTFVNGRKVLSAYLSARDVIRMGAVELVFDARLEQKNSRRGVSMASAGQGSRAGRLLTAVPRWAGKRLARLVARLRARK